MGLLKKLDFGHREPEGRRDLASNRMLEARLRRRSEDVAPRNDRLLGFFNRPVMAWVTGESAGIDTTDAVRQLV